MMEKIEFTVLPDGRILDLRPMYYNKPPLVYKEGTWIAFEGEPEEVLESKPLNSDEVSELTSSIYPLQ